MKTKTIAEDEGEDYCGLCCSEYSHPFKLQACGHKFCFDCIQSSIRVVIKDLSMYPIRCPECLENILVSDLNCLASDNDW